METLARNGATFRTKLMSHAQALQFAKQIAEITQARPEPAARQAEKSQRSRREQVEGSLKELDARRKKEKSVALSVRIAQAGLTWTTQKFWIISGILAAVGFAIAFVVGGGLPGAVVMAFATGLGLPRWLLSFLKKRREKAFLRALPDAVAKLMTIQVQVQQMAVEAAMHASKEMALQALLLDPVVHSEKAARGLLEELWEINRPYIRPCI